MTAKSIQGKKQRRIENLRRRLKRIGYEIVSKKRDWEER